MALNRPLSIGVALSILIAVAVAVALMSGDADPVAPPEAQRQEPASEPASEKETEAVSIPAPEEPLTGDELLPEGARRVEVRATDPESLRKAIEQLREDPRTRAVADEIEASLASYHDMLEAGADPEDASQILEQGLADSLTKQFQAQGIDNPRVRIRIQGQRQE